MDLLFYLGVGWLTVLLGISVLIVALARSTASRILALDLLVLVLIGLLALTAATDRAPFALDAALVLALLSFVATIAASRYYENREPFS